MNWSSQTVSCCKDELPVVGLGLEFPEPLVSKMYIILWLSDNSILVPDGYVATGSAEQSGNLSGWINFSNNGHKVLHVTVLTSSQVSLEGEYRSPVAQSQRGKIYWQRKGAPVVLQDE